MYRMLFVLVVFGSFIAAGCGQQQQQQVAAPETAQSTESVQAVVEQAQKSAEQGVQAVANAQQNVQDSANQMVEQAKSLLASAREMLNNGKFEEAIATAQKVLSIDPNNIDAKNIIETAKVKIAEMAKQKAGELTGDLSNKINALGN